MRAWWTNVSAVCCSSAPLLIVAWVLQCTIAHCSLDCILNTNQHYNVYSVSFAAVAMVSFPPSDRVYIRIIAQNTVKTHEDLARVNGEHRMGAFTVDAIRYLKHPPPLPSLPLLTLTHIHRPASMCSNSLPNYASVSSHLHRRNPSTYICSRRPKVRTVISCYASNYHRATCSHSIWSNFNLLSKLPSIPTQSIAPNIIPHSMEAAH